MAQIYAKSSRNKPFKGVGYPFRYTDVERLVQDLPQQVICLDASFWTPRPSVGERKAIEKSNIQDLVRFVFCGKETITPLMLSGFNIPENCTIDLHIYASVHAIPLTDLRESGLRREGLIAFLSQQFRSSTFRAMMPDFVFDLRVDAKDKGIHFKYGKGLGRVHRNEIEGQWDIPKPTASEQIKSINP